MLKPIVDESIAYKTFTNADIPKQLLLKSLPAGESLAAASIDTLGQCVLQSGIDHI